MDSHEARMVLRTSVGNTADIARDVILADIHEILERMDEQMRCADHLETADKLASRGDT